MTSYAIRALERGWDELTFDCSQTRNELGGLSLKNSQTGYIFMVNGLQTLQDSEGEKLHYFKLLSRLDRRIFGLYTNMQPRRRESNSAYIVFYS